MVLDVKDYGLVRVMARTRSGAAVRDGSFGGGDKKVFPYSLPSVGPGADPGVGPYRQSARR